jgi:hypothetical protein
MAGWQLCNRQLVKPGMPNRHVAPAAKEALAAVQEQERKCSWLAGSCTTGSLSNLAYANQAHGNSSTRSISSSTGAGAWESPVGSCPACSCSACHWADLTRQWGQHVQAFHLLAVSMLCPLFLLQVFIITVMSQQSLSHAYVAAACQPTSIAVLVSSHDPALDGLSHTLAHSQKQHHHLFVCSHLRGPSQPSRALYCDLRSRSSRSTCSNRHQSQPLIVPTSCLWQATSARHQSLPTTNSCSSANRNMSAGPQNCQADKQPQEHPQKKIPAPPQAQNAT